MVVAPNLGRRPVSTLQRENCGFWSSPQIGDDDLFLHFKRRTVDFGHRPKLGRRPVSTLRKEKYGCARAHSGSCSAKRGLIENCGFSIVEWTSSTRPIMSMLCTLHIVDAANHVHAMYFARVPPHLSQKLLWLQRPPSDSIVKVGCPPAAPQPFVDTSRMCPPQAPQEYTRGPLAALCLTTGRLKGCDTDTSEPP